MFLCWSDVCACVCMGVGMCARDTVLAKLGPCVHSSLMYVYVYFNGHCCMYMYVCLCEEQRL